MPPSGKVSAHVMRVYLEPQSQVTKTIKWEFPSRSEEESEAGGNLSLEAVLAESSFICDIRTGREICVFFTSVLFTRDPMTSGEKMILGDKEVSWSAGQGVCPWAEPTGPTAGTGLLCDVHTRTAWNWQHPGQHSDLAKTSFDR